MTPFSGLENCPRKKKKKNDGNLADPECHKHRVTIPPKNLGKSRRPPQNPTELRRTLGETPAEPSERQISAEPSERQISSESLAEGLCPSDGDPPEMEAKNGSKNAERVRKRFSPPKICNKRIVSHREQDWPR